MHPAMQVTTGRLLLLISVVALFLGLRQLFVSLNLFLFAIFLMPLLLAALCSAVAGFDARHASSERATWNGALVGLISGAITAAALFAEFMVRAWTGDWRLSVALLVTGCSYQFFMTAIVGAASAWGIHQLFRPDRF
jgi:hypothetical protein